MELKFQKEPLNFLNRAVGEVQNQEQTLEVKLSDGMPDIGRVLACWGQPILRSKEWRSGQMAFSGGVMVWTLYAPEDGTDARCVESWLPFQMNWDVEDDGQDGDIRIQTLLRFADARSVSARKLMLRVGLAALGEGFLNETEDISTAGEVPEDVQLLKSSYPVRLYKEAGEKSFTLDEDLTLQPSSPVPAKVIYYTMQSEISDKRVTGNRVAFRGNGNLHVLYRSDEGQLHTWDFELPFSMLGELKETYGGDAQADVTMCITNLELDLDDEGHMRLKCGLLGQYLVSDRQMLELIEDAYSPKRPVVPDVEELELPAILDTRQEALRAEQTIPQDADIVVDTTFLPDFPRQRRRENGVEFQVPGQFQALWYGPDGSLRSGSARWEGSVTLPADEETNLYAQMQPVPRPQSSINAGSINMRTDAAMQIAAISDSGIPMVTGLDLEPEREADVSRPSLILRRAGTDRLWDIAKETGSTVSAIRSANGFEGEPDGGQMLLIPIA